MPNQSESRTSRLRCLSTFASSSGDVFGILFGSVLKLKKLFASFFATYMLRSGRAPRSTAMQCYRHQLSLKVSSEAIFDTRARLCNQSGNGNVPYIGCLLSTTLTSMLEEDVTNTQVVFRHSIVYSPVHVTIFLIQQKCLSKVSRFAFYNKPF